MQYSFIPFLIVLGISLVTGFLFSKTYKKNSDYFLGNRSLGWGLLAMTFVATQIGGGFILGSAEAAYDYGIFGILYPLGAAFGFLALGLGFGAKLRSLELQTVSDIFEVYYESPVLKKITSLLSIISLTGILIAQAIALKKFLFSMGLNDEWIFLACWLIVIAYTTQGGFLAVVWTDTLQALVMIGMLLVAFSFAFFTSGHLITQEIVLPQASQESGIQSQLLSYLLMPFLFMFIEQDMVQRCFAGKTKKDVTIGATIAAVVLILLAFIPVYFGMTAKALGVQPGMSSKFMEVIMSTTNTFISTCAATSVLLAIISTASSLLCAVSSNLAQDFARKEPLQKGQKSEKTRLITLFVGLGALGCSYLASNIFTCMIASYELFIDTLFIPLVVAVFFKERCRTAFPSAVGAILLGGAGFVIEKTMDLGTIGLVIPLFMSGCGFLIGRKLSSKQTQQSTV
jgi:solute:Na+ symporter, SSS family